MDMALDVSLKPRIAPAPPVELVCVLSNHADLLGYRLITRRTFDGLALDYHLAINRQSAIKLNALFDSRPFKALRRHPNARVAIHYGGIADPTTADIYLVLTHGKSREKHRLRVPRFVMLELAWVAALRTHDKTMGRRIAEG